MTSLLLENEERTVSSEEDLSAYMQMIRQHKRLTEEEERAVAEQCATGDAEAICTMVTANLRLVVPIAREYAGRGVALMDLVQEGGIGLLYAAKKYDYTRNTRFSTYATKWIRRCISRAILNHAGLIRVPVHTGEAMKKLLAVREKLRQQLEREPTEEELGTDSGMTAVKVKELLDLLPDVGSLDAPVGTGEDTLGNLLEDIYAPQPQEELVRQELKRTIDDLLAKLNDRQRLVLRLRHGMEDGICHSLEDISKQLEVSKERTRQIEQQAMEKLRSLGEEVGLEDFL